MSGREELLRRRFTPGTILAICVTVGIVAAVAGWLSPIQGAFGSSAAQDEAAGAHKGGLPSLTISAADAEGVVNRAKSAARGGPQEPALADGVVTKKELTARAVAEQDCAANEIQRRLDAEGLGLKVVTTPPALSSDGFEVRSGLSIEGSVSDEVVSARGEEFMNTVDEIGKDCGNRHTRHLAQAYRAQYRASPAKIREVAAHMSKCLAKEGLQLPPDMDVLRAALWDQITTSTMSEQPEWLPCLDKYPVVGFAEG